MNIDNTAPFSPGSENWRAQGSEAEQTPLSPSASQGSLRLEKTHPYQDKQKCKHKEPYLNL